MQRIESIQYLRALAALMVVFSHALHSQLEGLSGQEGLYALASILGQTGVWMFFCISGFIMVYTTNPRGGRSVTGGDFALRRIARIVPLYWLCSTIYLVRLYFSERMPDLDRIVALYLFFPTLNERGLMQPFYGLGWTLNYEMFFYALFALALSWRSASRGPWLVVGVLVLMVVAGWGLPEYDRSAPLMSALKNWTHPIVLFFAAGILMAKLRLWLERSRPSAVRRIPWALVGLLAPTLILVAAAAAGNAIDFHDARAGVAVMSVLMAVLIVDPIDTPVHRLFVLLGEASFSIYLTHPFVVGPVGRLWARYFPLEAWPGVAVVCVVLASLLGVAAFRYVEQPLTRYFTTLLTSRTLRSRHA